MQQPNPHQRLKPAIRMKQPHIIHLFLSDNIYNPITRFVFNIRDVFKMIIWNLIIYTCLYTPIKFLFSCLIINAKQNIKSLANFIWNKCSINNFIQQIILIQIPLQLSSIIDKLLKPIKRDSVKYEKQPQKLTDIQKINKLRQISQTSNQVLLKQQDKSQQTKLTDTIHKHKMSLTYFVPTYLRVLLKNFTAIDLSTMQAQVNVDIIITFVYGNESLIKLPKQVANRLIDQVILTFQRDDPIRLTKQNDNISVKQQQIDSSIQFTVRKMLHMRIQSQVYYTPFQKLYLVLPITIQQLPATIIPNPCVNQSSQNRKYVYQATVKFNYMDRPNTKFITLDYKPQYEFGYYSLIPTHLYTQYTNEQAPSKRQHNLAQQQKNAQQKKQKIIKQIKTSRIRNSRQQIENQPENQLLLEQHNNQQNNQNNNRNQNKKNKKSNFQYSSFEVAIYKHPMASLIMIFVPLWSLAIINLGVFFQKGQLSQRIAAIASLMIAFIALNETIRSQIPPHPKVVFVQLLVYAQIFACFLCLMNSLEVRNIQKYQLIWYENELFMGSVFIFICELTIISLMTVYHYFRKVPSYKLNDEQKEWKKSNKQLNHLLWQNKECDKKFKRQIQRVEQNRVKYSKRWSKKLISVRQELCGQRKQYEWVNIQQVRQRNVLMNREQRIKQRLDQIMQNNIKDNENNQRE